jgi:hypothetical protein
MPRKKTKRQIASAPQELLWPIDLDNEPVPDYLLWEDELGWPTDGYNDEMAD